MTRPESLLSRIATALSDRKINFALIGGLAVSARTEPRFTRDVDLAVAVSGDSEAEAIIHSLVSAGYRILATVEQQAAHRLATVRIRPPGEAEDMLIDLLFASSGIECETVAAAETIELLPGLWFPVATVGHLIALKLLARDDRTRPQDAADLKALRTFATAGELESAREAAQLILHRGFNRGRNLNTDFEAFLTG